MKALSVIGFTEEEVQVSNNNNHAMNDSFPHAGSNTAVLFFTHVFLFTTFPKLKWNSFNCRVIGINPGQAVP